MEVIIGNQYLKDLRKVPKYVFVAADGIIESPVLIIQKWKVSRKVKITIVSGWGRGE